MNNICTFRYHEDIVSYLIYLVIIDFSGEIRS